MGKDVGVTEYDGEFPKGKCRDCGASLLSDVEAYPIAYDEGFVCYDCTDNYELRNGMAHPLDEDHCREEVW